MEDRARAGRSSSALHEKLTGTLDKHLESLATTAGKLQNALDHFHSTNNAATSPIKPFQADLLAVESPTNRTSLDAANAKIADLTVTVEQQRRELQRDKHETQEDVSRQLEAAQGKVAELISIVQRQELQMREMELELDALKARSGASTDESKLTSTTSLQEPPKRKKSYKADDADRERMRSLRDMVRCALNPKGITYKADRDNEELPEDDQELTIEPCQSQDDMRRSQVALVRQASRLK